MKWFYLVLVIVKVLFLSLGALLYLYADSLGLSLPTNSNTGAIITDEVFPTIALNHLPIYLGIIFIVGLLAAAYSSADSALTALTTSFCLDILSQKSQKDVPKTTRILIHLGFTFVLFITILIFRYQLESSVIQNLLKLAGYTYGPLLGLFAFGILTKKKIKDAYVPYIAIAAPILTFIIDKYSGQLLGGYQFGFELLLLNGLIMFLG